MIGENLFKIRELHVVTSTSVCFKVPYSSPQGKIFACGSITKKNSGQSQGKTVCHQKNPRGLNQGKRIFDQGKVREKSGTSQANHRSRAVPRQFLTLDSVPNGRQQIPKGWVRSARRFGACCLPFGTESSIKNCRGTARMR